ncbi:hypothetical protein BVC80_9069g116 [Macleaya cordata]|uniref:Thioesterase superfamily n=1 Tax=Macleaya cordata TaxID=56857 RepID=A0A200PP49_MACCD|nr:hypothetical protein BVC80_9069g116 [Macleaya cordata]
MKEDDDDDDECIVLMAKKWVEGVGQGSRGTEFETKAVQNIRSVRVHRGLIRCNFVVPKSLSDRDGNWHVRAIASLIDIVGAAAIVSSVGSINTSVDFNISYFSTAKIDVRIFSLP